MNTLISATIIDFDKMWWGICRSIMQIIDWIGEAFNFIIGANTVSEVDGIKNVNNIFEGLFSNAETGIGAIYWGIALACIVLMGVFIAIGAIKAQFTDDVPKSLGKMGGKAFGGVIKIIAMPLVFWIGLMAVGVIFTFLIDIMSFGSGTSLAQQLCDACNQTGGKILFTDTYNSEAMSYGNGFQYLLCILSGAFLIITLTTCCISLTKRFIEVFFYYLVAPVAIARAPIDDGKSFDLWKENTVAKLLGAGGIIIAMYLYYKIMPVFIDTVKDSGLFLQDGQPGTVNVVGNIIIIMFLIGGSAVPASASMMFAQLISQGAGQNEANNMIHTQQMMGNAFRMANAVAGKALAGALMSTGSSAAGGAAKMLGGSAAAMASGGGATADGGAAKTLGPMAGGGMMTRAMGGGGAAPAGSGGGTGGGAGGAAPMAAGGGGAAPAGVGMAAAVDGGGASADGGAGGAAPMTSGGNTGVLPIGQKGYRQTMADQKQAAKQVGKNIPYLANLGLGGLIGAGLTRGVARLTAPIVGRVKYGLNRAKGALLATRPGMRIRNIVDDNKMGKQMSADRRSANAEMKSLAHKDKKWKEAMSGGKDTAGARMNKEVNDLQNRVAKFDKDFADLQKTNPQKFAEYRSLKFRREYDTVNRRLTGQQGGAYADQAKEGLDRLAKIANGTYDAPKIHDGGKK